MQVHNLVKPKNYKHKKRVGRGGKRGTYSGRGVKGQRSRAGFKIRPQIWDYIAETPKLTGTTNKGSKIMGSKKYPISIVNLFDINKVANSGDVIDISYLVKNKLARKYKGRMPQVKVLGKGEITKKIEIKGLMVSKSVQEKIEAKGGTVE